MQDMDRGVLVGKGFYCSGIDDEGLRAGDGDPLAAGKSVGNGAGMSVEWEQPD